MHIPDGILEPQVQIAAGVASLAAVGFSMWKLRDALEDRTAPMIGVMAAGIFAGQMVNYPLPMLGVSGHLMGGVLAAVVLGPWGAIVALANVLIVQCFLYADGGPASLGANLFNMGVVGGALGYPVFDALRRWKPTPGGTVFAAVAASWVVIPLSALAFSAELAFGGKYDFAQVSGLMLFYHVFIGLGEALITGLAVAWIVRVRPDLIYQGAHRPGRLARVGQVVLGGLAVACAVCVFLAPLASEYEDGLEAVGVESRVGFNALAQASPAPFPNYGLPEVEGQGTAGESSWLRLPAVVTASLGILGTLATFVLGVGLAQSMRIGQEPTSAPAA